MLADGIGMSLHGLNLTLKNKRLTVETLEKIAAYYKKPISYFFGESEYMSNSTDEHLHVNDKSLSKLIAKLELLGEILKEKEKNIEELNREIGGLKLRIKQLEE
ncbi:hypothetical protein [Mariniphaga sediminis]|uniref:hypothetical protein n=1 Tax=Mariniphaga sediminis TaxID=1628158 RepID=UPI003562A20C